MVGARSNSNSAHAGLRTMEIVSLNPDTLGGMSFVAGNPSPLKKFHSLLLCGSVAACVILTNHLHAQTFPRDAAAVAAQGATEDVAARSRDLSRLLNDIWQDKLKHEPEYATYLGDKRYDSELTDYSPRAVNEALARGRTFIDRLSKIDTTGLPQQEQLSADLMLRSLIEDQEGAPFKEWEMPANQYDGIQLDLPQQIG